jgi:F-box-like
MLASLRLLLLTTCRSKRTNNQPLSLSKASNSLLFTTQASRDYRPAPPPPEPIGKRTPLTSSSTESGMSISAAEILMLRKSKERHSVLDYDYDISGARKQRSRPPSIRSSRKSSVRSFRSRHAVQRKQSIETVQSRFSISSSMSGSHLSGRFSRLAIDEPASLTNIPTELVLSIVRYLTRSELLNLVRTCQQLRSEAVMFLYAKPFFTSTYRFAQFVTTISHNRKLADLVRELDLSHIQKLPKDSGLAGWREWKYRTEPLYSIYPSQAGENSLDRAPEKHPLAHPHLLKHTTGGHDIPLGSLMHIVKSCPHLRCDLPFLAGLNLES